MIFILITFKNVEKQIKNAYDGTKENNFTKWINLKLFLNLTKGKSMNELSKMLNLKSDNVSKKVQTFKKAVKFLSYIDQEKYDQITICITYFQKINKMDWNEVLKHMNNMIDSKTNLNSKQK